ncbi:MAG TPA: hypothetical protein VFI20_07225 [Terracidiphilus sp.]|nr:hypothetical protein [Terracidiphilus sp.]
MKKFAAAAFLVMMLSTPAFGLKWWHHNSHPQAEHPKGAHAKAEHPQGVHRKAMHARTHHPKAAHPENTYLKHKSKMKHHEHRPR